jgi:hypothetical protein
MYPKFGDVGNLWLYQQYVYNQGIHSKLYPSCFVKWQILIDPELEFLLQTKFCFVDS